MKGIKFNDIVIDFPESGGLNIADLPKFTNKLYINMANATSLAGVLTLPIVSSSNFVVDWGDGTTTDYTEAVIEISHTYSDTSFVGWVYIYGDWKGLKFSSAITSNRYVPIKVVYDENITQIPDYAFYSCSKLKFINFLNSLTYIGTGAFRDCASLSGNIIIPDSVTSLGGQQTFYGCNKINSYYISNNVTEIPNLTFYDNDGLLYLTIPEKVNKFGYRAIERCSNLRILNFKGTTPPVVSTAFSGRMTANVVTVPYNSLKLYKTATNLVEVADKIYPESGTYSETITIPVSSWDTATNTVTVEAVGATSEDRNIITWNVSNGGVQVENTYGLKCTAQGTMSLTFSCETIPTEDVEVSVRYMLTNY